MKEFQKHKLFVLKHKKEINCLTEVELEVGSIPRSQHGSTVKSF